MYKSSFSSCDDVLERVNAEGPGGDAWGRCTHEICLRRVDVKGDEGSR